jgi:RHS repeat-associated protein
MTPARPAPARKQVVATWKMLLLSDVLPEVDTDGGRKLRWGEGEIYFNARYYDPVVGRFLTEDPSRKGHSWYSYCNNNPLTYIDPTGMKYESAAFAELTGNKPASEQIGRQPTWGERARAGLHRAREKWDRFIGAWANFNGKFSPAYRAYHNQDEDFSWLSQDLRLMIDALDPAGQAFVVGLLLDAKSTEQNNAIPLPIPTNGPSCDVLANNWAYFAGYNMVSQSGELIDYSNLTVSQIFAQHLPAFRSKTPIPGGGLAFWTDPETGITTHVEFYTYEAGAATYNIYRNTGYSYIGVRAQSALNPRGVYTFVPLAQIPQGY